MNVYQLLNTQRQRWHRYLLLFSLLLAGVSVVYLFSGEHWISPFSAWSTLEQQLLWQLRLPRWFAVVAIGASLAVSGAVLQVLLGNVLAEPGVIGVSGGGSLAMVAVLFWLPWAATPTGLMCAAILGCFAFTLLLVAIAAVAKLTTTRLLLIGVALGMLSGAVVTWAFYFSDDLSLRQLMYWLMGSVSGVTWSQLNVAVVVIPALIWLCRQGAVLDRLMLGEIHAKQLGVDVNAIRWKLILAVAVSVGGSVALGGVIGFVGLVVPHLLRLALGNENRYLIPLSAVCGALLLLIADEIARLALHSAELPLGVVTTTLGTPLFIWMLLRR